MRMRNMRSSPNTDDGEDDDDQEERVQDEAGPVVILGGCGCCCCFILTMLFLCSFKGLHATSYAIKRNSISGTVDVEKVFKGGRHCIGFWNTWVEFPATVQLLEWTNQRPASSETKDLHPFAVRTREGYLVTLSMTVQYVLQEAFIGQIYTEHKMNVETFFISTLRSTFQTKVAEFEQEELWSKRIDLVEVLMTGCNEVAAQKLKNWVTCWGVQVHGVELDGDNEKKIEDRQVTEQQQAIEDQKQIGAKIRAQTKVMESGWDKDIAIVNAQAGAQAKEITMKASSDAELLLKEAQASVLSTVKGILKGGTLTASELNSYFAHLAAIRSKESQLLYGDFSSQTVWNNVEL